MRKRQRRSCSRIGIIGIAEVILYCPLTGKVFSRARGLNKVVNQGKDWFGGNFIQLSWNDPEYVGTSSDPGPVPDDEVAAPDVLGIKVATKLQVSNIRWRLKADFAPSESIGTIRSLFVSQWNDGTGEFSRVILATPVVKDGTKALEVKYDYVFTWP